MLLIEKKEKQKRIFLKTKLDAIIKDHNLQDNSSEMVKDLNTHFSQFTVFQNKQTSEITVANSHGNGCSFILGITYISKYIDIQIFDLKYRYQLENGSHLPFLVYHLLEQFTSIETEYLQLAEFYKELENRANKIRKRIVDLFQVGNYNFYLTETENKIMLSVPVCKGLQLDIPIYYSKYEQIIPQIMLTIQKYEKMIAETKIKMLVSENRKKLSS
jgi:hypothetical protein